MPRVGCRVTVQRFALGHAMLRVELRDVGLAYARLEANQQFAGDIVGGGGEQTTVFQKFKSVRSHDSLSPIT